MERAPADRELWRAAAEGDSDAFAVLYEQYVDRIYSYCFRRTASWATAQDLTSTVFLEAWRRRRAVTFGVDGSVVGWLFGVANNVVRGDQRSQRRHREALAKLPPPVAGPDLAEDTSSRLDSEAQMRRVLVALDRLSSSDREVLALSVWSGLTQPDIARALGVPVGTVKSRLARARQRLHALADSGVGGPGQPPRPEVLGLTQSQEGFR